MLHDNGIIDGFEVLMGTTEAQVIAPEEACSSADALVRSLNNFGRVDMEYIVSATGKDIGEVALELRGAVYQDPDAFGEEDDYDPYVGWVVSDVYLGGNIALKLEKAHRANRRFGGFEFNIQSLERAMPPRISIADIYISLGATWIPADEYEMFILHFLGVRATVSFSKELNVWDISVNKSDRASVLNTITYGVRKYYFAGRGVHQYLTAIDIIEQTMNSKNIRVYDYVPKKDPAKKYDTEPVLNIEKTIEAQEIQRKLINAFSQWVYTTDRRMKRFEDYYNKVFLGYVRCAYDGSFLTFEGINPAVTLFNHQKDAVARVLLSQGNVLFAHDVGTGKTFEMIASVSELYRLGLSRKNLVVVPNNVLKATIEMHRQLYPDDRILEVYPKDFVPKKRREVLRKIRDEDYTAIYMAYSSFDMIVMSKEYHIRKMEERVTHLEVSRYNTTRKSEKKAISARIKSLKKRIEKFTAENPDTPWLTYDELGITTLVVDEAHNYKNIPLVTKTSGIVGMGGSGGSKKCCEMLEKVHSTPRVIFSTGTPLTNSLADLYAFQTYLQPEVLEYHNISTFDTWINTFGRRETLVECDLDSNSGSLRTMTRFSSFHNLGELMSLFSQVCDFHHASESDPELPLFNGHTDICVPKNTLQHEYIAGLSERVEQIRTRAIDRKDDNLLKVTIDGRKAALDIRLTELGEYCFIDAKTKIDVCADKVWEVYTNHPDCVQIVFSDIGVPKDSFNVYDELRTKLIAKGFGVDDVAFVHDATTETMRAKLFCEMNKGIKKVVIGSTEKLGVGVNVQEKLVAIHHLSVPWRPADMVQREGRIIRKGNTSKEVYIFRYITEGSFDAYSWQLLENKQRFISSFLGGISCDRESTDIADAVLSYAEVKALAIGNPLIKRRVEVANAIDRKKLAVRLRQGQLRELNALIVALPKKIKTIESLAESAKSDYVTYSCTKHSIPVPERTAFGEELLLSLNGNIMRGTERYFDTYQGFEIILPAQMPGDRRHVVVKGKHGSYVCELSNTKTPIGCTRALDYLVEGLGKRALELEDKARKCREELKKAHDDIAKGNEHIAIVDKLEAELAEIDKRLEKQAKKDAERKGA